MRHSGMTTHVISVSAGISACEKEGDVCKQLLYLLVTPGWPPSPLARREVGGTRHLCLSAPISACKKEGDACKQLFCLLVKPAWLLMSSASAPRSPFARREVVIFLRPSQLASREGVLLHKMNAAISANAKGEPCE